MPVYRKYTQESLEEAIRMIEAGRLSRKAASRQYKIPKTTILDKLAGRVPIKARSGPPTILNTAEELRIATYIKHMIQIGYPITMRQLQLQVKTILDEDNRRTLFKDNMPGRVWYQGFFKRHPDISLRTAQQLGHERAGINAGMIQAWFDGVINFLNKEVENGSTILTDSSRIFNADESGFPLCVKTTRVLAPKGAKHVYHVCTSDKTQITTMVCMSAAGKFVPPFILYPGQRIRDVNISSFPEARYATSPSGWMTSKAFVLFLQHLLKYCKMNNTVFPILLFVDGHSSHISYDASEFCKQNGIILYCLLANATHLLQPCDVGFFGPMKAARKQHVQDWQTLHPGQTLTKKEFPNVFKQAYLKVAQPGVAVKAFRRCGLYPFTATGVDMSRLGPSVMVIDQVENHAQSVPPIVPAAASTPKPVPAQDGMDSSLTALKVSPALFSTAMKSHVPDPERVQVADTSNSSVPTCEAKTAADPTHDPGNDFTLTEPSDIIPGHPLATGDDTSLNESIPIDILFPSEEINTSSETISVPSQFEVMECSVSPTFDKVFQVPPPRERKSKRKNTLPKAVTSAKALEMLQEREERKENKAGKGKKTKQPKENKAGKGKGKKTKQPETKRSETTSKKSKKVSKRSDDDIVSLTCPGCKKSTGDFSEFIDCTTCGDLWHKKCTGDKELVFLKNVTNYMFVCKFCDS